MSDLEEQGSPAAAERIQRFRFRVVAPDGRELLSDVVQVEFPPPPEPAAVASRAEAPLSHVDAPAAQAQAPAGVLAAEQQPAPQPPTGPFRVSAIVVSVRGTRQGQFKAESRRKAFKDHFDAIALDYELTVPIDAATGQRSGQRLHHPLSVTKEWSAATPQFFQALVTNEVLQTVEIDCLEIDKGGRESVVHKVTLTNAAVAAIRQRGGSAARGDDGRPRAAMETVAFAFEKIEHSTADGTVIASDDRS